MATYYAKNGGNDSNDGLSDALLDDLRAVDDPEPDTPPFKQVYVDGFTYNQSQNDFPDIDGRLPNDTIGTTSQLPNEPSGLDLSETVFFDTTVKRTASSNGSAKFIADIEKRWFNNNENYKTFRYQHVVVTPYLRTEEIWFGFSLLFPENFEPDTHETIVYNFGGVGGGAFSLRINNGYFHLSISRLDENTTSNRLIFVLEEATGGIWHDFIIKAKWSSNTADGELTVWKNGKLARLYNPVTRQKWVIPTSATSGIQSQYIAFPAKGYIDQTVEDEGLTVSVLNWKGFTLGISEDGIDHNFRTGFYYSGWNTNIDPITGEVRPGTYEQGNPLYIEPSMRTREMWTSNVGWQPKNSYTENLSHEELYTSLDANNQPPLEKPNWYVDGEPVEITYPVNNQYFVLGTPINIETNITEGDVDFFVNNNLIQTISEYPYSIFISDIPLNDSIVDLHFDENLLNWGTGSNSISPVNPEDITYEIGPRNHAINLGNDVLHNQKSFLVIENSGPLSEISNEFTISFWIKSNHGSGLNPYIVHNIESVNHSGIRISVLSGGEINLYLYDGTGDPPITFRTTLNSIVSPSEYRHFAITYDGNELKWYCNLELDSQTVVGGVDVSPTTNWHINASSINQAGRQQLSLDDFRIYNYSISEEEIHKTVEDNYLGQLELKVLRDGVESDPVTINIVESVDEYRVTVTQTTGGVVTGGGVYEDGSQATLTAVANEGWRFVKWSDDSTENPYVFEVTEDVTLSAVFEPVGPPEPTYFTVKGKFRIV